MQWIVIFSSFPFFAMCGEFFALELLEVLPYGELFWDCRHDAMDNEELLPIPFLAICCGKFLALELLHLLMTVFVLQKL
jgi:hypothetical protein